MSTANGRPNNADAPTICLVGATGVGKSSTGNSFFGARAGGAVFHVEEGSLASVTSEVAVVERKWRGCGERIRCIDSPGLGDSEGRDSQHVVSLADVLKDSVKYVDAIVLVFNSQEPRLNCHLKEMLRVFKEMFGAGFLRHTMLCFTRWEYDKRARKKREKAGITEEHRSKLMNEELQKLLGHDFDCPCIFLDNAANVSDTELWELFDDEWEEIRRAFDDELEKVREFMNRAPRPFFCQDVKAVALEKERLKKKIMQLIQLVNEEALGRQLISVETGVIRKGWLRWKRRWIWGVLRRQHLRLYVDEDCVEQTGPREVDLTGCICSTGVEWQVFPRRFPAFTVYRPVNVQGAARSYFCHVFQVKSLEDRQRWVLLVQEATQISESCHRIEKFHQSLRIAPSKAQYERAIAIVVRETMVVPVEWVFQQGSSLVASIGRKPSLQQAMKDVQRDQIRVDGVDFSCPSGNELAAHVCQRVLEGAERPQDENAEVKAAVIARDVLLGCSRTQGGGDTLDAVRVLFGNNEVLEVHCKPEAPRDPIIVRVMCRKERESDVLRSISADTGVPQFQRDGSAKCLSSELVRAMDLDGEQQLCSTSVDADSWVPDNQMVQCMRCGERFNPFLRRHHCRACGALVCYSCSRHFVPLATAGSMMSTEDLYEALDSQQVRCERVCFLCYQKAVIKDLNQRKERGQQAVVNEEELLSMRRTRSTSHNTLADEAGRPLVSSDKEGSANVAADAGSPDTPCVAHHATRRPNAGAADDREGDVDRVPAAARGAAGMSNSSAASRPFPHLESFFSEEGVSEASSAELDAEEVDPSEEDLWPSVSIEIASRFKIVAMGSCSLEEWYVLECKYVRVVRWSGLTDEGRVFISVLPAASAAAANGPSGSRAGGQ